MEGGCGGEKRGKIGRDLWWFIREKKGMELAVKRRACMRRRDTLYKRGGTKRGGWGTPRYRGLGWEVAKYHLLKAKRYVNLLSSCHSVRGEGK